MMYRNTRRRGALIASAAFFLPALVACGSSAAANGGGESGGRTPDTINVAQIPAENATEQAKANKPLFALLEKETGKKVNVVNVTSYAAVIEAQRAGKADVAVYGPASYAVAVKSGLKITPAGILVDTKDGKAAYKSYGIVPADSPIKSLADFRGKKVCFVDENSTSGYLYPMAGLQQAGIDAKKDVTPIFAGGHDASVLSVLKGQCDAGFAGDSMVDKTLVKQGKLKPGQLRVLWRSPDIPNSPVAISNDLAPELKDKLIDIFRHKANVDYMSAHGFCSGKDDCMPDGGYGYIPTTDARFDIVRQVCKEAGDESCSAG